MAATGLKIHGLKKLFVGDFNQISCVALGNVARFGNEQHAKLSLAVRTPDCDEVADLDGMCRLNRPLVEQHQARFAKLLRDRATWANAT